ncbi:hypothetical protein A3F08_02365 [Candidatus Berkelbacteria bacterium RIFCSPHIGHO2_12_FULL_36_9]|uniref:Hydrolase TatD n=1 Tax=Candidatus Berkelbacteria bacterium RIFCSPHIGHO2_12_FULL_36_9 TaxID=1797469 RepID=A0A1F5EKW1_9BACT|nr:MAG: hypothetical protein A3F08_02365 [Candidatus Berkelbacteria bacterium RIFCSPHIGHO2_12_FULL_36_9]
MFIDTHAHLNFKAFKDDYKGVIKRAFDANVKRIINVGSNYKLLDSQLNRLTAYGLQLDAVLAIYGVASPISTQNPKTQAIVSSNKMS